MSKCPKCHYEGGWQPLFGKFQCLNIFCQFYSEEHSRAVQEYETKHPKDKNKEKETLRPKKNNDGIYYSWDEMDKIDTSPGGWSPYISHPISTSTLPPKNDDDIGQLIDDFLKGFDRDDG